MAAPSITFDRLDAKKSMTVAISDYVGEPTTTTREFLITLRPGTTPCVWNVAGV